LRFTPMLSSMIDNLKLDKYVVTFETGQTVFLEGDDSQDLYIVVEGKAGILKGTKRIAEISGKGSVFGEMSFLLGENRTATVKAVTDLKVIKIPKEEIPDFLTEFPELVREFARYLAERLHETSQIVYGMKEFSDQLPDAVILTDKDGKILSWNRAAEKLYGREEDQMRYKSAEEIYEDPAAYRRFLDEVISKQAVSEKTLRVRHPRDGIRHVSTSTTVLYDGQHNFEGVLSLGRDVTQAEIVAKRYQRVRRCFIPLSALLVMLAAGIFFGYPYFSKGYHITDAKKQDLKDDLAVDFRLLRSLLVEPFGAGNRQKTTDVMRSFFDAQKGVDIPFTGLVLLGEDKRVFDAYSILPGVDGKAMIGSSYSGIDLGENERAPYKVLTLYREHKDHPMGIRHTEIAFRLKDVGTGWLIFQVDMDLLKSKYNADEKDLRTFRFEDLKENAG
jgi:PAS domain S-box-containing protein